MSRRLFTWMAIALVGGMLLAACGSTSTTTSSSQSSSTPPPSNAPGNTSSDQTASTGPTSSSQTPPASAIPPADLARAVAECKSVLQRAPTLSSSLKTKVEGICNKAAHGNLTAAKAAAKEVCTEIINGSPIPAGPAKEEALAACKRS